jgi:hypothetical protein
MATSVATLRKEAKDLGIPVAKIRGLTEADEIQAVIDEHKGGGRKATAVKKKKTSAVAKKKNSSRAPAERKQTRKSASSKSSPATSKKKSGTAKRTATASGGRNLLEDVDFTETEGWNPREGSAPDRIVKALRKAKGNRSKAYEALKGDLYDFVSRKNSKGEKRSKAEAEWQLRYRISRTAWDFAKRTGQHEPSQNRAVYGEGGTGIGVSGGMPVDLRPEGWGEPVFGKAKRSSRKVAPKRSAARSGAKKKTATSRKGGAAKRKVAARRK